MLEKIHRIEFHAPLFHAGKNFGNKIEAARIPDFEVTYDDSKRLFYVDYRGRRAVLPEISVFMWETEKEFPIPTVENEHKTSDVNKFKTAQVSSPMGHVFEGPGKGRKKD